jgi:sulfite reductase (NADPH) flavoprotein alpha-component
VAHQWHTLTKTGKIDTLNKLNPGAFVEIHPEDAASLGIADNALVKVGSRRGFAIYPAKITTRVRPGDCFAPFHWNDLFGENLAVNAATSEAVDPISFQPEFKFTAVALARVELNLPDGFSPAQKEFLRELLSGLALRLTVSGSGALEIPASAPFSVPERKHLDEIIAQFCTDHSKIEKR